MIVWDISVEIKHQNLSNCGRVARLINVVRNHNKLLPVYSKIEQNFEFQNYVHDIMNKFMSVIFTKLFVGEAFECINSY